jgi:hypothetical protein
MSKPLRLPNCDEQALLDQVQVRLVERTELERFKQLLDEHHYLGSLKAVGQRLYYVATDAQGQWLALLVFSAPAKHLKHRDQWIGWSAAQRHRRLSLVTNNSRFLILPERSVPNLASKVLSLTLDRLASDAIGRAVTAIRCWWSKPSSMWPSSAVRFIRPKDQRDSVARELFNRLELEGRLVSLDALHTQDETARALVLEHGADYLLSTMNVA